MGIKVVFIGLAALLLLGCPTGGAFLQVWLNPYSREFRETPVGEKSVVINNHRFSGACERGSIFPESGTTDEIVRLAGEAGITDLHALISGRFSILGIYRRQTLIVYGD